MSNEPKDEQYCKCMEKYFLINLSITQNIKDKLLQIQHAEIQIFTKREIDSRIKSLKSWHDKRIQLESYFNLNKAFNIQDLQFFGLFSTDELNSLTVENKKTVLNLAMRDFMKLEYHWNHIFDHRYDDISPSNIIHYLPLILKFFFWFEFKELQEFMYIFKDQVDFLITKVNDIFEAQKQIQEQKDLLEIIIQISKKDNKAGNKLFSDIFTSAISILRGVISTNNVEQNFTNEIIEKIIETINAVSSKLDNNQYITICHDISMLSKRNMLCDQSHKTTLIANGISLLTNITNLKIEADIDVISIVLENIIESIKCFDGNEMYQLNDTCDTTLKTEEEVGNQTSVKQSVFYERYKYLNLKQTETLQLNDSMSLLSDKLAQVFKICDNKAALCLSVIKTISELNELSAENFNTLVYYMIDVFRKCSYDYDQVKLNWLFDDRIFPSDYKFSLISRNAVLALLLEKFNNDSNNVISIMASYISEDNVFHFLPIFLYVLCYNSMKQEERFINLSPAFLKQFVYKFTESELFTKLMKISEANTIVFDIIIRFIDQYPDNCVNNTNTSDFLIKSIKNVHYRKFIGTTIQNAILNLSQQDNKAKLLHDVVEYLKTHEDKEITTIFIKILTNTSPSYQTVFIRNIESDDLYRNLSHISSEYELTKEVLACLTSFMGNVNIAKTLSFVHKDVFENLALSSPNVNCTDDFLKLATGDTNDIKMNSAISLLVERSLHTHTVLEVTTKLCKLAQISDSNAENELHSGVFEYALSNIKKCNEMREYIPLENIKSDETENDPIKENYNVLMESIKLLKSLCKSQFTRKLFSEVMSIFTEIKNFKYSDEIFSVFNDLIQEYINYNPPWWFRMANFDSGIYCSNITMKDGFIFAACLRVHNLKESVWYPLLCLKSTGQNIMFYFKKDKGVLTLGMKAISNNKTKNITFDYQFDDNWFSIKLSMTKEQTVALTVNTRENQSFSLTEPKEKPFISFSDPFEILICSFDKDDHSKGTLNCDISPIIFYKPDTDPELINFNYDPMQLPEEVLPHVICKFSPRCVKSSHITHITDDVSFVGTFYGVIVPHQTKAKEIFEDIQCIGELIPCLLQLDDQSNITEQRGERLLIHFFEILYIMLGKSTDLSKDFLDRDYFQLIGTIMCRIHVSFLTDKVFEAIVKLMETYLAQQVAIHIFLNYTLIFGLPDIKKFVTYCKKAFDLRHTAFYDRECYIPLLSGVFLEYSNVEKMRKIKGLRNSDEPVEEYTQDEYLRKESDIDCLLGFYLSVFTKNDFNYDMSFILSFAIFNDSQLIKQKVIDFASKLISSSIYNMKFYKHLTIPESLMPWIPLLYTQNQDIQYKSLNQCFVYFKKNKEKASRYMKTEMYHALALYEQNDPSQSDYLISKIKNDFVEYEETIPFLMKCLTFASAEMQKENDEWLLSQLQTNEEVRKQFLLSGVWYLHMTYYCAKTNNFDPLHYCYIFRENINDIGICFRTIELMSYEYNFDWKKLEIDIIETLITKDFLSNDYLKQSLHFILQEFIPILLFDISLTKSGERYRIISSIETSFNTRVELLMYQPIIAVNKLESKDNRLLKLCLDLLPFYSGKLCRIYEQDIDMILLFTDVFNIFCTMNSESDCQTYLQNIIDNLNFTTRAAMYVSTASIKNTLETLGYSVPPVLFDMLHTNIAPKEVVYSLLDCEKVKSRIASNYAKIRATIVSQICKTMSSNESVDVKTDDIVERFYSICDRDTYNRYKLLYDNSFDLIGPLYVMRIIENCLVLFHSNQGCWSKTNFVPHFSVCGLVNRRGGRTLLDVDYDRKSGMNLFNSGWMIPKNEHIYKDEHMMMPASNVSFVCSCNSYNLRGTFCGWISVTEKTVIFEGSSASVLKNIKFTQKVDIEEIEFILRKRYVLEDIACEIHNCYKQSLYVVFPSQEKRDTFLSIVNEKHSQIKRITRLCLVPNTKFDLFRELRSFNDTNIIFIPEKGAEDERKMEFVNKVLKPEWLFWRISNFEYLSYLNVIAGRSFNNMSTYPIFPWIIQQYDRDIEYLTDESFRDLSKTMRQIDEAMWETFKNNKRENAETQIFPHYGYMNPTRVAITMMRQDPFNQMIIDLQNGQEEKKDRLMMSVASWFDISVKSGMNEITPEWFSFPRFLVDTNMHVSKIVRGKGDVVLPKWSNTVVKSDNQNLTDAERFIQLHRVLFESDKVSYSINMWINLLFGIYRSYESLGNHFFKGVLPETVFEDEELINRRREHACNIFTCMDKLFDEEHEQRYFVEPFIEKTKFSEMTVPEELKITAFMKEFVFTNNFSVFSITKLNERLKEDKQPKKERNIMKLFRMNRDEQEETPENTVENEFFRLRAKYNNSFERVEMVDKIQHVLCGVANGHNIAVFMGDENNKSSFVTVVFLNENIARFVCQKAALISAVCVAGNRLLFTCGEDGTTRMWSLPHLQLINELCFHLAKITKVSCSVDCNLIATYDASKNLILQNIEGRFIRRIVNVECSVALLIYKSGKIVTVNENSFTVYDNCGAQIGKCTLETRIITAKKFVSRESNEYVVFGCQDTSYSIKFIDLSTFDESYEIKSLASASMFELRRDTMQLLLAENNTIYVYPIILKKIFKSI